MTDHPAPVLVDGVHLVALDGELDLVSAPLLEQSLLALVSAAAPLLVDLSEATFFDSAGVRLLDRLRRRAVSEQAGLLVVAPLGSPARRVLEIVSLVDGLVVDSRELGLTALRPA